MVKFYRLQFRNRNNINNEYEITSHSLKSSKKIKGKAFPLQARGAQRVPGS